MITKRTCRVIVYLLIAGPAVYAANTGIFTAAEQGNLETAEMLIQENPDLLHAADDQGYTALHKAAYANHANVAEYLIAQGADINAVSSSGSAPLHGAAFYGHVDIVRLLVDNGADPEITNAGGYTPLLSAAAGNHDDIVRILVASGANINVTTNDGRTPLFIAVWNADIELTRLLVEHGAEVNIPTTMGVSLPYFATAFRDKQFGLLLKMQAADFAETDELGLTMLHYSAARGFTEQARMLLTHGAEADAKDVLGRTPLFYATLWGYTETAEALMANGASAINGNNIWFTGDYLGRPTPGKTPVEFVGDQLRTPFAPHGRIALSPDGKEIFWCHQAMPIQAMWYIRQVDGVWQQPIIAPFTDPALDYADGSPCFSADGNRVYYHTHRPTVGADSRKEDSDIWYVDRAGDGWGEPVRLGPPVNTDKGEFGPMVAPSGNLYFIGNEYDDVLGAGDIYLAEYIDGVYNKPKNLGSAINSEFHELSPVTSSDESYMVFASDRPIDGRRNLRLFVSFKNNNGDWTEAIPLGEEINREHTWHPFITADDKYIFYQQGSSYYWFSADLIDDLRDAVMNR